MVEPPPTDLKTRKEYYKAAERSNATTHNQGRARHDSRRTSGVKHNAEATLGSPPPRKEVTSGVKHNAEATPRYTPVETKELTEYRSNHVRPQSHETSTNIPDLHEVGKEQPGVTPRDTKQPSEHERLTIGTATSDLHKVEGPQAEPPCTSDMPRGQGTTPYNATTDDTKERVTEPAVGCLHQAPRENPQS
ncbi:hypothetical protein Taro_007346 [Colocasia esculenta]|uniref:Uncharacterized protein n=1 Tax=Colocasia esculenta TaxID=4460 RepID=A0A843TYP2_COLES|nr:hypothetical protein [Colocasia esculenta]